MQEHQLRIRKPDGERQIIKLNEDLKPSFWQRIQLIVRGYAFLGYERRPGWCAPLPVYIVRCEQHGYFMDYPHGYTNFMDGDLSVWSEFFTCPRCSEIEEYNRLTIHERFSPTVHNNIDTEK